jgi:hypothetical protein
MDGKWGLIYLCAQARGLAGDAIGGEATLHQGQGAD